MAYYVNMYEFGTLIIRLSDHHLIIYSKLKLVFYLKVSKVLYWWTNDFVVIWFALKKLDSNLRKSL